MPLLDDPWLPAPDEFGNIAPVRAGAPVAVFRYDGSSVLDPLPNVECLHCGHREGTDPGRAAFRYNLASGLPGAPTSIEEALGSGFAGALVVNPGDRLVVQAGRPDGGVECLFDGIAVDFGMDLDPDAEEAHIGAVGVAWRLRDAPIPGALMRGADNPTKVADVATDLPAVFNPDGRPNCVPDGYWAGSLSGGADRRYPTFLDPLVIRTPDVRTAWTLAKAARHLCFTMNPGQEFVANPDGAQLDAALNPAGNPTGSTPVACPDTPITGKDWPGVLYKLIGDCGVGMHFDLATVGGLPRTALALFPRDAGPLKPLYLAPRGTPFSPALFNFHAGSMHRDTSEVVNRWTVRGGPLRYEVGLVLAPGFPMASADAVAATLKTFDRNADEWKTTNRDKYRLYVFDETGEGHYAFGSATKLTTIPPLDGVLGTPSGGKPRYVTRRRRPIGKLLSLDAAGKPFKAALEVSTDYAGTAKPGIWDGTGTWQVVTKSTWKLLDDRLGIEVTDSNPEDWDVGGSAKSGAPFPGGVIAGVTNQATAAAGKNFWLKVTLVFEGDRALEASSGPTGGSPLPQTIARVVDASDRLFRDTIHTSSRYAPAGATAAQLTPRDDSKAAQAEADALRAATEAGVLDGPVVIPRLTTYYRVGDRIGSIEGRGLGLRTDAGTGTAVYPVVVGVRHDLAGDRQSTTLEISDAGSDRRGFRRRARRPPPRRMSGSGGGRTTAVSHSDGAGNLPNQTVASMALPPGSGGYEGP